jgi:hypothetical protein
MAHPTLGQIHAHVLQRRTTPEGRSVALQGRSDAKWLVALYPAFPTRQPKFLVCSQFVTSVCVKSNSSAVGSVAPKQHCPFASSAALTFDMIGRTSAVDRLGVPSLRSIATTPQCRRRVPNWLVNYLCGSPRSPGESVLRRDLRCARQESNACVGQMSFATNPQSRDRSSGGHNSVHECAPLRAHLARSCYSAPQPTTGLRPMA